MNKIFKLLWLNLAVVPALFACFIGGLFFSEWLRIRVIADPKIIGNYYFGGKAMVVHESWRYASASTYAWTSLVEGIFLLALGMFTFGASIKSKGRNTAFGCLIIFICFLIVSAA
jgi:hypothetical protein